MNLNNGQVKLMYFAFKTQIGQSGYLKKKVFLDYNFLKWVPKNLKFSLFSRETHGEVYFSDFSSRVIFAITNQINI